MLIPDGDVAGVIATTDPDTTIDMYMGSGGAPEGVLAAEALRCVGGQFKGRLLFRNDDERGRAHKWGIEDIDKESGSAACRERVWRDVENSVSAVTIKKKTTQNRGT